MPVSTRAQLLGWAIPRQGIDTVVDGYVPPHQQWTTAQPWGTANRAIYCPVRVPRRVLVRKLGVASASTGTGNFDVGLYDAGGTRLVSSGSTAKGAVADLQVADVTDTTIGPGLYYLALNTDSTTDTYTSLSAAVPLAAAYGVRTQAVGALTLPSTATWAVDNTLTFIPGIAMVLVTELA